MEQVQAERRRQELRAKKGGASQSAVRRKNTFMDDVAEYVATSDGIRKAALVAQGITDSPVNPMSVYMRLGNWVSGNGYRTGLEDVVKPQNALESGLYAGTETLYNTLGEEGVAYYAGLGIKAGIPMVRKAGANLKAEYLETLKDIDAGKALGEAYDVVKKNPFIGKSTDVLTSFELNGRRIGVQRGEAILSDGKLITQGQTLKKAVGTKRNFGMTKDVFLHNMSRKDVQNMRRSMRKSQNIDVKESGKRIYENKSLFRKDRKTVTSTSRSDNGVDDLLSSDYWVGAEKYPRIDWK